MSFSANIQNFDDWCCIFNSSIEPRGEYTQLMPDLIKLVQNLCKNQIDTILDQEDSKKLVTNLIPNTITKFLYFSVTLQNEEVNFIFLFLKKCGKFAFFSIKNNIKPAYPSLIKLFDSSCIFYQKNDYYNDTYDQIVKKFINQIEKNRGLFEPLNEYVESESQDDLEKYYALFLISHNLMKSYKFKDFTHHLIVEMLDYFYIFLKKVKNLRELNIAYLKEIFTTFFDDMKDIVDEPCTFKLLVFFVRCLKSDYLDKQLFAAQQIVDMCDKPQLFEYLLNFNSQEVNLIDLIITNNFHFEVMSILNRFLTQMANQKMLTIHHLNQLWEKCQNLHITERKSSIELISKCFDFFDESELQKFIEHLYKKKNESNDVYCLLSNAVIAIQHKESMKELSFDIINYLLDDIESVEAQEGISMICSNMMSSDIYKLIAHKIIFFICNADLIDFTLDTTLKLIQKSNIADDIFNNNYVDELIGLIQVDDENDFDNRRAIFQILHALYKTTSLKPNSDIFQDIISIKEDNVLWNFLRKLLITEGIVKKEQIEPIEKVIKSQDLQTSTISFANLLISFLFYINRPLFLNVKFNENSVPIQSFYLDTIELEYFDLLFELYLKSEDRKVSNKSKDFILKIYTSCNRLSFSTKDIQQRIYKLNNDEINFDEIKLIKILTLLYKYLQMSEISINPEDFGMPSHKFSKKLIEMTIVDSDNNNKVLIHVNPKITVHKLKQRISVIAKTKIECISIPQTDIEKDDKLVSELKLHSPITIKWQFKSLMRNRQIYEPPPSCELHKTHFSDCLIDLLDKDCSDETYDIVWKLLKYLPTNEKAISTLDDFDSFFDALKESENEIKFRYYLQIFLHKYDPNNKKNINKNKKEKDDDDDDEEEEEECEEDEFQVKKDLILINFVDFFTDEKYPKKELLQIFIEIFDLHDLFKHAQMIIPALLLCINQDNRLSDLVNKIFTGFLKINPTVTSEILMENSDNLTETINKLDKKDWSIFLNLLSNSLNLEDVTDMCIIELSNEGTNTRFFLKLSTQVVPKLELENHNEDNILRFIKLFNICIDFFNEDKNINDVLNLLFVLIQGYPKLIQKQTKKENEQIPIEKIISIAFNDPPEELQTVIFKILNIIIQNSKEEKNDKNENDDLSLIKNQINQIISITVDRWNYDPSMFRKVEPFVGLRNLGATCFANSVIQQIFHLYPIRFLLLMHHFDATDEYSNLQHLFQQMMFTERSFCNPAIFFANWHGWYNSLINTREQQDSFEFFLLLIDDNEKKNTHFPKEINSWFSGEMTDRLNGVNDPFNTKRTELLNILPLSIKGFKNIDESFNEFNQVETLYDYSCDNPKRKITVHKSTRMSKPPIILVIQLKRFDYDYKNCTREKVNDKFEFPDELDISSICDFKDQEQEQENDSYFITYEDCLYDLHGVVVHTGNANGGHYYSIIDINNQWFCFNDSEVSKINRETMEKSCYGGDNADKTSAYLLFYVRKDFKKELSIDGFDNIELSFDENPKLTEILKKEKFSDDIKTDNLLFKRTQSLFNIPVIDFIMKTNDFEINLKYFINILCHSTHVAKSTQFQENLNRIIDSQQKEVDFVNYLNDHFNDVFNNYLNCYDLEIMKNFNKVVIHCIRNIISNEIGIYRIQSSNQSTEKVDKSDNKVRLLPFILCDKIYEIVMNHINAFRQIPLILSIVEFCISMDPIVAYNDEFGFKWFDKIIQLINNIYGIQRTSQFLSNADYSSLFKSLISMIKLIPKNSIDCTFLLIHSQSILKSDSNLNDYIDLLFLCSKNQNIDINDIFGMISSLSNYPKIICNYFTDLVCESKSYEPIAADIFKFIHSSQSDNNDVVCISKIDEDSNKERCCQIIQRFSNEIEINSPIFISNFIKFSPFMVRDLLTFDNEYIRSQCENLYYKIFRCYEKMPENLTFYKSYKNINDSDNSDDNNISGISNIKKIHFTASFLRNTSMLYNNQMEQLLQNIEIFLDKLKDIPYYYPNVNNNNCIKITDKLYGFSNSNELSYRITVSNPTDESKFKLLSVLKLYRWIVCSMHKECKNISFYSVNSDSFNFERADFILNLIHRFLMVDFHPDYNIRQLLLLLGEFPVEILQNNLYKSFNMIFENNNDMPFSIERIQVEFEPFIHIISKYKDDEDLINDIISIFLNEVFTKNILRAFLKHHSNPLLDELIPILKEYKNKESEIIEKNEDLCKLLKDLTSKRNLIANTHYTMTKSGSLIQHEVNRNLVISSYAINEISDNPGANEIKGFIKQILDLLLKERIPEPIKKTIKTFTHNTHPEDDLDINLIQINAKDIISAIEKSSDINYNLKYIFKLIRWCSQYSSVTRAYVKRLILDIFNNNLHNNFDNLIIETARFAARFDFDEKLSNLLKSHYVKIETNHSPSIGPYGSQRNKKMIAFFDGLICEIENANKGDIDWMKDFAEYLIKNEHQNQQEKTLKKFLISKLSDEAILSIFADLENDFKKSKGKDNPFANSMAFIIKESQPELIKKIREKTTLTESDIRIMNPNLAKIFKSIQSSSSDDET